MNKLLKYLINRPCVQSKIIFGSDTVDRSKSINPELIRELSEYIKYYHNNLEPKITSDSDNNLIKIKKNKS